MIKRLRFRISRGPGALTALAAMFLLSGVLRAWDGAGAALAREGTASELTDDTAANGVCIGNDGLATALEAIQNRELSLLARERALSDRLLALEAAEQTVTAKLSMLEEAEAKLAATMARSETAVEEDLARLTSVYENMKPKDAAPVFSQMDPEFAAGFLGRMRSDAAAAILSGLDPETAYTISVLLAGRNASAPVE